MGQLVASLANEYGCEVVGEIGRGSNFEVEFEKAPDICVDFSSPDGLLELCGVASRHGVGIVSGTTGLSGAQSAVLASHAEKIPILHAANFSIGVFVLNKLVKIAAQSLPSNFEVEIIERHHSKKKDSPSGTAMTLLKNIESERPGRSIFGRHGTGERTANEICVHAVRCGDIVGEHEILFAGQCERLEFIHRATDRGVFARGALHVAKKFANFTNPGLYALDDVL
jgi:4-hydroxy-tetrahydrodipicolinate reductase